MEKLYKKIGWKNSPNLATPLGATNLNKMDVAIDGLDNRTIELDSKDAEQGRHIEELYAETRNNAQAIEEVRESTQYIDSSKIVTNKSGSPAYIDDASNINIENITFYGESKQNGTPTPTSPIPIESKIVNRVDVLRKNLLQNTGKDIERIGLTYTMQSDGSVKVVGTTTEADYQVLIGQVTLPKGSYILSGAPNNICRLRIAKGDNSTLLGHDLGSGFSFTLEEESTVFVSVRTQSTVGTNINVVYYPMIRPSFFTDGTYEPYQSQTVNLSAPIELNGFGGVRDTDKLKNIYVKVFTGNESFYTYTPGVGGVQFGCEDENFMRIESENVLCTHLPPKFTWNVREDGIALTINNYVVRFRMESLGIFTVEDLKAKLKEWYDAGNPMVLYAPIKTPIETELPQADIDAIKNLHTYKPNTVVMNDADAEMDVHYVADAKTYIDKKFEALASAIVNQ